jgi:hypothetical protein
MKKVIFNFIFLGAACAISLVSCKKDEKKEDETPAIPRATITINNPASGAMFNLGATVDIDVDITAAVEMHGYEAYLINESAGDTVWSADAHVHGDSYEIIDQWVNNVADHSDMKLRIIAEMDHDGHTSTKEVHFHCHPM